MTNVDEDDDTNEWRTARFRIVEGIYNEMIIMMVMMMVMTMTMRRRRRRKRRRRLMTMAILMAVNGKIRRIRLQIVITRMIRTKLIRK